VTKPAFENLIKSLAADEVVIPRLRVALWNPTFEAYTQQVYRPEVRDPDGWFHPSTHPLWPERQLYWYLAEPDKLIPEQIEPASMMAFTQGHFWHELIGQVGMDAGIFKGLEVHCEDPETKTRGSIDWDMEVYDEAGVGEFKTCNPRKLSKLPRGKPYDPEVVQAYFELFPEYYAQGQEYMRITRRRRHVTVFLSMQYPFEMREVHMEYNPLFALKVAEKYRRVLRAVELGQVPEPCCGVGSSEAKSCFARTVCPVGRM
jgi:hypothetical protein